MPRRTKHNIESNCVVFDDYCHDETNNKEATYKEIYKYETNLMLDFFNKIKYTVKLWKKHLSI